MTQQQGRPDGPRTLDQALLRWESSFSAGEYLFCEQVNTYLASKAGLFAQGDRALSIAGGEGRNSVWRAEQRLRVYAFASLPTAVANAARLALRRGGGRPFSARHMLGGDVGVAT